MKRSEIIAEMLKGNQDEHIAVSEWCATDILSLAKQNDTDITEKEANDLIDQIHREGECSPIDFDTLSDAISAFNDELEQDCFKCKTAKIYYNHDNTCDVAVCGDFVVKKKRECRKLQRIQARHNEIE